VLQKFLQKLLDELVCVELQKCLQGFRWVLQWVLQLLALQKFLLVLELLGLQKFLQKLLDEPEYVELQK
jgi:hypothetical protein